mmetsp:Transcript_10491/g.18383  ORF Transcript_10491/g.18383 Transcript_10491/m.18383 type:complete len:203 (-) Transcript_10491:546-1154(-)
MDTLIGFVGDGYAMIAADTAIARSIVVMHDDADKIMVLDDHKLLAFSGEVGDSAQFCEYIQKRISLYHFQTGIELDTHAAAYLTRGELSKALRKTPYQCNVIVAGHDEQAGASLYYIDYLGSIQRLNTAAQGYGGMFALSIMDRHYKPGLSVEEGVQLMKLCISEVKTRLVLNSSKFIVKIVDKDGCRQLGPQTAKVDPMQV